MNQMGSQSQMGNPMNPMGGQSQMNNPMNQMGQNQMAKKSASPAEWRKWDRSHRNFTIHSRGSRWAE